MLKRFLVVLLSTTFFSSTKAEPDNLGAGSLNTIAVPAVKTGNSPDNLYKEIAQAQTPKSQAQKVKPKYIKPASGIGIIATDDYHGGDPEQGWACTAFCVADDVIATSAHCLTGAKGGDLPTLDSVVFSLRSYILDGVRPSVLLGRYEYSKLQSVDERNPHLAIYSGYDFKRRTPASIANDWAFAKLQRPICRSKSLSFRVMKDDELITAANNQQIFMIAYDEENIVEPNLSFRCKIFSKSDSEKVPWNIRQAMRRNKAIVIHDCISRLGSSGGPVFVDTYGVPEVVAINQGIIVSEYRIPVNWGERGNKAKVTYQTIKGKLRSAVHPGGFIEGFERFREEDLLNSLDEFKEVQAYLKKLHLYHGKIDGLLGPGTKHALIRYEKMAGLVPIGLPTQKLLSLLRAEFEAEGTASID